MKAVIHECDIVLFDKGVIRYKTINGDVRDVPCNYLFFSKECRGFLFKYQGKTYLSYAPAVWVHRLFKDFKTVISVDEEPDYIELRPIKVRLSDEKR